MRAAGRGGQLGFDRPSPCLALPLRHPLPGPRAAPRRLGPQTGPQQFPLCFLAPLRLLRPLAPWAPWAPCALPAPLRCLQLDPAAPASGRKPHHHDGQTSAVYEKTRRTNNIRNERKILPASPVTCTALPPPGAAAPRWNSVGTVTASEGAALAPLRPARFTERTPFPWKPFRTAVRVWEAVGRYCW